MKVEGAVTSPKGIRVNCRSRWPSEKAVLSLSSGSISMVQYAFFASKVVNHMAPPKSSISSSIRGIGQESIMVRALIFLKSTQNLSFPSFFRTNTTGDSQGEALGSITPISSISSHCLRISLRDVSGIRHCLVRTGMVPGSVRI